MAIKAPFEGAVIFCSRRDVRDAVRDTLKLMGVPLGDNLTTADECIEQLEANRSHLLVIDWELSGPEVVKVLESVKSHHRIEIRPIFLLANEITAQIVATGYEYSVSQTHSGPVSKSKIKECLLEISRHEKSNAPIKQVLKKVSEARSKNEWETATVLLENIQEKLPGNARIAVELSENYIRDGKWKDAIEMLEPFVAAQPPYSRALHLLGRCHMQAGKFSEASIVLTKAKLLNPFNVSRLVDLGHCLMETSDFGEAKKNFSAARKMDPKNRDAKVGEGKCLLLDGDVNDALVLFKDISDPQELASIFNMAAVMTIRGGKFDEAMSLYDAACNAIGTNDLVKSRLIFNKGLGYKRQKKIKNAIEMFSEALKLDPTFEKAEKNLAAAKKKIAQSPTAAGSKTSEAQEEVQRDGSEFEPMGLEDSPMLTPKKSDLGLGFGGDDDDELEDDFDEESITFV